MTQSTFFGIPVKYSSEFPDDCTVLLVNTEMHRTKCKKCKQMRRTFKDFAATDKGWSKTCKWCEMSS